MRRISRHVPVVLGAGLLGMLLPVAATFAVTILTRQHVDFVKLLWQDKLTWLPIALGFGIQVGVYILLRKESGRPVRAAAGRATTGTSGGLSTLAMMACCAPGALNVLLPVLGVSAAASVLAAWKMPLMVAAAAVNVIGITAMLYTLVKRRRALRTVQPALLPAPMAEAR